MGRLPRGVIIQGGFGPIRKATRCQNWNIFYRKLRQSQVIYWKEGDNFLNSQFVHTFCRKAVEKFGDESKNIIKLCAFLRIALFLINKFINNINILNQK